MSTFLQICQDVQRECGIAGPSMTSVAGQSGELERIVQWVEQAYRDIQNRHGGAWRWLRKKWTINLVASDRDYAPSEFTDVEDSAAISRFAAWRLHDWDDPPRIYETSVGNTAERWMIYTPYEWWRRIYDIGVSAQPGQPIHITFDPSNNVLVGPTPSVVWTMTGDYFRSAQTLSSDGDVPEMPAQYHDLIMYRAMRKYALYESAEEVRQQAEEGGKPMMRALENDQTERVRLAQPLA